MTDLHGYRRAVRLRIYLGEDKHDGALPLYHAIVNKARQCHLAGATVVRGTEGYGHSTRLHTADVLFSEDLPVLIEMVDSADKIDSFVRTLAGIREIALITREEVMIPEW